MPTLAEAKHGTIPLDGSSGTSKNICDAGSWRPSAIRILTAFFARSDA